MSTILQLKQKADRANRVHLNLSPIRQFTLPNTEDHIIDRLHHLASQGNYQADITFANWEKDSIGMMIGQLRKVHNLIVEPTEFLMTYRVRWDV